MNTYVLLLDEIFWNFSFFIIKYLGGMQTNNMLWNVSIRNPPTVCQTCALFQCNQFNVVVDLTRYMKNRVVYNILLINKIWLEVTVNHYKRCRFTREKSVYFIKQVYPDRMQCQHILSFSLILTNTGHCNLSLTRSKDIM